MVHRYPRQWAGQDDFLRCYNSVDSVYQGQVQFCLQFSQQHTDVCTRNVWAGQGLQ